MGKTYLTEDEVRDIIRERTKESSLRKVAGEMQLSPAYLSDILSGRRDISDRVHFLQMQQALQNNHGALRAQNVPA